MQTDFNERDLLLFQSEGEDELKKRQLMELAIINGTYRDSQSKNSGGECCGRRRNACGHCNAKPSSPISGSMDGTSRFLGNQAALQSMVTQQNAFRAALSAGTQLGGAPLIRLQVRKGTIACFGPLTKNGFFQVPTTLSHVNGTTTSPQQHAPPPLIAPGDTSGLLYAQVNTYTWYIWGFFANFNFFPSMLLPPRPKTTPITPLQASFLPSSPRQTTAIHRVGYLQDRRRQKWRAREREKENPDLSEYFSPARVTFISPQSKSCHDD